jgi:RNA polymerase sigma-70 factor (ECF subfamily)
MIEDDDILIEQFKAGSRNAFRKIMDKYNAMVFRYVKSIVRNREVAEDMTQDVFIKAFKALPSWQPRASLQTWLYTIAKNQCIDYFRSQSQRMQSQCISYPFDHDKQVDMPVATNVYSNPERVAQEREIEKHILNALSQLSDRQRDVFILYNYDGLQIRKIAEVLGIAEGTVKVHHHNAIHKLREILGPLRDKL